MDLSDVRNDDMPPTLPHSQIVDQCGDLLARMMAPEVSLRPSSEEVHRALLFAARTTAIDRHYGQELLREIQTTLRQGFSEMEARMSQLEQGHKRIETTAIASLSKRTEVLEAEQTALRAELASTRAELEATKVMVVSVRDAAAVERRHIKATMHAWVAGGLFVITAFAHRAEIMSFFTAK